MPATSTSISDWLSKNGWSEYAAALTSASVATIEDLGETQVDVESKLAQLLPSSSDADRAAMVQSWVTAVQADDASRTVTPTPAPPTTTAPPQGRITVNVPPIPAGRVVSLDGDNIEYPDNTDVPFPSELPPIPQGVHVNISSFAPEAWMVLARNLLLLHAFDIKGLTAPAGKSKSPLAHRACLDWVVPSHTGYAIPADAQSDTVTMDYSASRSRMRDQMILDAEVDISGPFVGAAIEAGREEQQGKAATVKRLLLTATHWRPIVTLRLGECTTPSDDFVAAITDATHAPTILEQYDALQEVFATYGHVLAREVTLGGAVYMRALAFSSLDLKDERHLDTVAAAMEGAVNGWTGAASGTVAIFGSKATSDEQDATWRNATTVGFGVDDTKAQDASTWRVINRTDLVAVTELLADADPELKGTVDDIWTQGRQQRWQGNPPEGYADPLFYGEKVTIAMPTMLGTESRHAISHSVRIVFNAEGPHFLYPTYPTATDLPSPIANKLDWKIQYTGRHLDTPSGVAVPLYWIVSGDGSHYLSLEDAHYGWGGYVLRLLTTPDNQAAPEKSTCAWQIDPVDPFDDHDGHLASAFVLTNWVTQRLIGPLKADGYGDLWGSVNGSPQILASWVLADAKGATTGSLPNEHGIATNSWEILAIDGGAP